MKYDEYAILFDKVFPLNPATLSFLKAEFNGKDKILDLGCARGLYTNALSQDFNVSGVDLSPSMIDVAKAQFPNVEFSVQDMRCFDGVFDGIFIIGNTLVHLSAYDEIKEECEYLYNHLNENGRLIIQIINYDRIYKYGIDRLPEINRDGVRFIREYELKENEVIFNSTLIYNEISQKQSVSLYPLKTKQLTDILTSCGFKNIKLYDGFKHQDFSADSSMQLVVTADR